MELDFDDLLKLTKDAINVLEVMPEFVGVKLQTQLLPCYF